MSLQETLKQIIKVQGMEVLQKPDAASQKAKLLEILARRGTYSHGSGAHGGW